MENKEPQGCKAPLEDIKRAALEHYEELATKCHHWNSFIPQAIKAYQEPTESPSSIEGEEKIDLEAKYCVVNLLLKEAKVYKEIVELAAPYLREMEMDNCHDPSVGLYRDNKLSELVQRVNDIINSESPSHALPIKEEETDCYCDKVGSVDKHSCGWYNYDNVCERKKGMPAIRPAPIEQEKKWDDMTDGEKLNEVCPIKEVICPACGGDGKETCDNPDHGFIEAMPGETGRLGCPVCGHDPNYKVNKARNTCPLCGGIGHVIYEVADEYGRETGYDEEFMPYSPSAPTSTAKEEGAPAEPEEAGDVAEEKLTGEVRGDLIHELGYIPTANAFKIAEAVDREIENATTTLRADLSAARSRITDLEEWLMKSQDNLAGANAQRNELQKEMEAYRSFLSKLYEGKTDILTFSFADELADIFSQYPTSDKQKP